ncbi:MAG: SCO family protein [Polyangiaceae bacterium]
MSAHERPRGPRRLGPFTLAAGLAFLAACGKEPVPAPEAGRPAPAEAPADAPDKPLGKLTVPDVTLTSHRGEAVRLKELLAKKTVAMSFIFTRCTTICPPIGIQFSRLQKRLGADLGKDVELVSISIDPENDTPEVLRAWGERFGAGPGWTLLTGSRTDVESVLKALTVYTAAKEEHAPIVLIGNGATGEWTRSHALSSPDGLWTTLDRIRKSAATGAAPESPASLGAERYFGDAKLIDQDGKELRLYTDVLRGRTVLAHSFFTTCTGSCPVLMKALTLTQERLGDRLGKDVVILSITADPENDTPQKLKEYSARVGARPGWHFVTGEPELLAQVRQRFGQAALSAEDHSAIVVAGNDRTGLWKKAFGLAPANEVASVLLSVADDRGGVR